jgi:hypothetical protein
MTSRKKFNNGEKKLFNKLSLLLVSTCGQSTPPIMRVQSVSVFSSATVVAGSQVRSQLGLDTFCDCNVIHKFVRSLNTISPHTKQNVWQVCSKYEAHPVSKVPWGRLQKRNTISWKYFLQQIQQVFSYFSTYSPPELRHLPYRGTNF